MEGWIKLHRSCLDHWLYTEYRPLTRREAWETILLTVNYEASKTLIKGQIYECNAGQSLLSLENWAKKFVWSVQQVRTFFKLLEADSMIKTEGLQYTTRLTICNWGEYQGVETDRQHAANTPLTDHQQTANTPLTTIEEREEDKEYKEDIKGAVKSKRFYPPSIIEVQNYISEKGYNIDAEYFVSFYASKGWKVGKEPMKDWKMAIVTWSKRNNQNTKNNGNRHGEVQAVFGGQQGRSTI